MECIIFNNKKNVNINNSYKNFSNILYINTDKLSDVKLKIFSKSGYVDMASLEFFFGKENVVLNNLHIPFAKEIYEVLKRKDTLD